MRTLDLMRQHLQRYKAWAECLLVCDTREQAEALVAELDRLLVVDGAGRRKGTSLFMFPQGGAVQVSYPAEFYDLWHHFTFIGVVEGHEVADGTLQAIKERFGSDTGFPYDLPTTFSLTSKECEQ